MSRLLTIIVTLLILANPLVARVSPGFDKLNDFRPVGEVRLWTFVVKDSTAGRLTSLTLTESEVDGEAGMIVRQALNISFKPAGSDLTYDIKNDQTVALNGGYLGSETEFTVNEQSESIRLRRERDKVVGVVTRDGNDREISYDFKPGMFAADNLLFDLHEMYLALRTFEVGDTLRDTLLVPHLGIQTPLLAYVEDFRYQRLYNEIFDSLFIIRYEQPFAGTVYLSRNKDLAKADIPGQRLKAYLDAVRQADVPTQSPESSVPPQLTNAVRLARVALYTFVGLLIVAVFARSGYRWGITYLALACGALTYLLMIVTQIPLQEFLFEYVLLPQVQAGGSGYLWALLPSLAAGLLQELAKLGLLYALVRLFSPQNDRLAVLGAAIGAGFGILEACYMATFALSPHIISWPILERSFTILFHATAGTLIGFMLRDGWEGRKWMYYFAGMVAFNSMLRYLPVFVQNKVVSVEVMYLMIPAAVIGFVFMMLLALRSPSK